ncbi:BapA prefix-like domain-containing protein [Citrobacter braakii]|nr:BapA prefix-like domain-containing protein [Citrobacter braakii]
MRLLAVVSKLTGVSTNVEASEVTLSSPSIVKLSVSREEVSQLTRVNQDLVVTLRSGETITIKNFYLGKGEAQNQLVLEDSNGALWWVQDTDGAFHFQHLDDLTPLMTAEGSHEGGAVWPWVLGGIAVAGGIGLAAGGGGGGGGGGSDNNAGNGNAGNGNGSGGNGNGGNGEGNGNGDGDGDGDGGTPPTTTPNRPDVPVITSIIDNQELITGPVNQQESTNDNTPTLQGTGPANATLHIFDNGVEIGQVTIDANGNWSFTPSSPLADGTHQFTVSASNGAGSSGMSDSWEIIVDSLAPDAPVVTQETDNVGSITGFIANNGVTDDATPTLTGTGEVGSFISISDNGILIGMAQVDDNGNWTFTPDIPLSDGVHNLTLTQTDAAGNVSAETRIPTFTVDTTPPAAAVISSVNPEGNEVTGRAEAGSLVIIIGSNNQVLGSTTVGQTGNFVIAISPSQTHGEALIAKIQDQAGNIGPDTSFNATNSGYPGVPVIVSIMDDFAPSTGPLSNNQATNDQTPTLSGTADANSTVNIYNNGVFVISVLADASGNWTWTSNTNLQDGLYAFTATATNHLGTGGTSPAFNINIDTQPPSPPDDLNVSADGTVVTGTTEPGNTVVITGSGGTQIGSGVAGTDGSFTITINPPQTNGETIEAIATDPAGNPSLPETALAPDITAPQPPTNLLVNGTGDQVTGKAEPNSTVNILDPDGNIIGTATADTDGDFTATLVPPQTNGETLTANATDTAGNKGNDASVNAPDTTAPDAPTGVTVAGDGGSVSGHAEAGSTVTVKDSNGNPIGIGQADSGGNFTVSIAPSQKNGETVKVTATDSSNNESQPTSALAPDITAPNQPVIIAVTDDVDDFTGPINNNGLTNDDKPKIEGIAEAGSRVKIYDNGTLLATVNADNNGNWNYTPTAALSQGAHVFTVTATDAANNTSSAASWKIIVDSIAPTVPVITLVNDDVGSITGNVANNGWVTNDNTPTLSGTGEPGSLVSLYDGSLLMTVILVDSSGTWSYTVPGNQVLSDRTHQFTVSATDAAGNVITSSTVVSVTVDTQPPGDPVILVATDDVGNAPIDLPSGSRSNDTLPELKGTGIAGSTITLYEGSTPIGSTTVLPAGTWSIQLSQPLSEGAHNLSAIATDAAGNASNAGNFTLTIDTTPPVAPVISSAEGLIGTNLQTLSNGSSTKSSNPELSGTGEPGAKITIYDNGGSIGTVTVQPDGSWTFTPTSLADGPHKFTATATDVAGNTGIPSASFTLTVDNTPPAQPAAPIITDDVAPVTGVVTNGNTNDTTPTFSGTGNVGDLITLYLAGTPPLQGTATVGADGTWSVDVPLTPNVSHTLTFGAVDAAGNSLAADNPLTLIVDTLPPATPTVTSVDPNGTLVSGTADAGSTVIIRSGNTILGQGVADGSGNFAVTISPAQTTGQALNAIAQDTAGNQSDPTTFNAATSSVPHPPTLEIVDDIAPIMGVIGNGKTTNDTLPLLQGTATAGASVTIYQNGASIATVTADAVSGAWSYQLPTALTNGITYNFTVTQTVDGTPSGLSPNYAITIDTTPPQVPTITSIIDDIAPGTGSLDKGQITNDSRPTFNGTGEAGATITLYDNGIAYATTTVNSNGFWSFTPTAPLGEGDHIFTARATDAAGNQGDPSGDFQIIVDTLVPNAPSIVTVTDNVGTTQILTSGQLTNDNTPTLAGVTEADSLVTIRDNGAVIGTTISDENGNWSFTPAPALGEGSHSLTATVTDGAGNISPTTPPFVVVVDTLPPAAPTITSVIDDQPGNTALTNGQLTNDAQPTLNGKGEIGAIITIRDNGVSIGTAQVDESGNWRFTPDAPLGQGQHIFTTVATDQAGNSGGVSSSFTIELDSVAPSIPVISTVQDSTAPTTGPITNGQTTNESRPALSGTGEIGATITVLSDGQPIGTTTVGANGTWSLTPTDALSNGPHTLTVTATDSAGNTSQPSNSFTLIVDTVLPGTPAITQVADDVGPLIGNLNNGQATNDPLPTLSGTAEANSTVRVYDNGSFIGFTSADGTGAWSFTPGTELGNGNHALTVTATDAAGNVSPTSAGFNIVVDTVAPLAPTIIQAFDDVLPGTGTLSSGAFTNDTRPVLNGSAEAGARVAIYDNGTLLATVTAAIDGTWEYLPAALGNGQHVFTAIATDAAGNVSPTSGGFIINVDTIAPSAPLLVSVVDDIAGGVFNAALSNGQLTNDARPTLNGTAEAGSTVSIYDGSTLLGTALVQSNNSWSFTPTTPLTNGSHTFTVTATDAAGNTSSATAGFSVVVDTTAPTQPSISSIIDDVGPNTGAIGANQPTNDARPTLNGTTEANARVDIYDNGSFVISVTADGSGNWSYTPTTALAQGTHSFTITATDSAGNTSGISSAAAIVVDTVAPGIPTGLAVNANGTTLTGVAEPNSTVIITSSGGTVLGTATANASGNFTFTLNPPQISGQTLQVSAQDAAGNIGTAGNVLAPFTGVPPAPVIATVLDDVGTITGPVAAGKTTNDTLPTLSGTAQANAIVSLYNNGVLMGTTTADGNGIWSFTPSGALSEGNHAFTATATNANGASGLSSSFSVIVDTTPPTAPTILISADGGIVSGVAEAGSTVTISLPGGTSVTAIANSSGVYSVNLPVRQIEGQSLSATATDAAGNTSSPTSAIAPVLPLLAEDNVTSLPLQTDVIVSTDHQSDYGFLLVNALGNVANVLGNDTASVNFSIASGGSGSITINAAATGVVLSLLNTLEVVIQRFDTGLNAWVTVVDTGKPDFASLLTLGASGVTLNYSGLTGGDYRVVSYNTNLLATGAYTSLDVSVVKASAGTIIGGTTESGNIITDTDPANGQDNAPSGTLVTSITDGNGNVVNIPAGGIDVQGKYGILHINQNGSYTYTLTNTSISVYGRSESFTYTLTHGSDHSSAKLVVTLGQAPTTSTVTAADDAAVLTYGTQVIAVDHLPSQQTGFTLTSVGLGNVLDVSLVNGLTNPIKFNVDDGATRTLTVQANVLGVTLGGFDLYVYRFNESIQQYEQYRVQPNWVTALLGGSSSAYTITLPGGDYLFLLNASGGLTLLTSYTLNIQADHTYAVDSLSATTNGNLLVNDSAPANTVITEVNGIVVNGTGTTTINGQYGTLTIDAKGNYTYTLRSGLGADGINTPDSFVYKVRAPNGDTGSASLNIKPTPQPLDAVNDISSTMAVTTQADTSRLFADNSVGNASWNAQLLSPTSQNGTGVIEVATGTAVQNAILHFNVASGLTLGGLTVTWALYDSNNVKVASNSFNGGLLIGGNIDIALGIMLHPGNYRLDYTGSVGALGLGNITITPSVKGTIIDLQNVETSAANSVAGNIYDGDHIASVHTLLTVSGTGGSTATLDPLSSTTSAIINGLYGKLTIGIDGHYTYALNSDVSLSTILTKETFTYTLNDQNGHTDTATLTINMNPQVVSTVDADRFTGSVYGDTLIYHLLNANDATGGNVGNVGVGPTDTWTNFSLAQGDKIDIGDLLVGWNGQNATLGNYLTVTTSGNNTVIAIDRDGTGNTYHSTNLITLENVHTTLDELVQQNHIVP